jgi:hypothetical protein
VVQKEENFFGDFEVEFVFQVDHARVNVEQNQLRKLVVDFVGENADDLVVEVFYAEKVDCERV